MSGITNKTFTCPYYTSCERRKRDRRCVVHCEFGSRLVFPSKKSFQAYVNLYCAGDYRTCGLARLLTKYYEERDNEQEKQIRVCAAENAKAKL